MHYHYLLSLSLSVPFVVFVGNILNRNYLLLFVDFRAYTLTESPKIESDNNHFCVRVSVIYTPLCRKMLTPQIQLFVSFIIILMPFFGMCVCK